MSSGLCLCKDDARRLCAQAGACAVGFARVQPLSDAETAVYDTFVADGRHAGMDYLANHAALRRDPASLLEGARTIICCAFAYPKAPPQSLFAGYALGRDYHDVLRKRLRPVAAALEALVPGSQTRICVDTAPLRERFWARRAGVGFIGLNNQLIVPGIGSRVFLAEILWTAATEPDAPLDDAVCCSCLACIVSCPGRALDGNGGIDCRRCLSYLTIEHRGSLPGGVRLDGRLYGCDICQDVCPHNRNVRRVEVPDELRPSPQVVELTAQRIAALDRDGFSALFSKSAVKRAKLEGLQRNALRFLRLDGSGGTSSPEE